MAQIPDYDVDRQASNSRSQGTAAYASTAYAQHRQHDHHHQQQHSTRPQLSVVSSNLDQHSSNSQASLPDTDHASPSDPRDFYRQYRDSFRTREPSGIYVLGSEGRDGSLDRMTSVLGPARVSHFESKTNGVPTTSVTVRLNNLAKKASQESMARRDHAGPALPRGRQASLKALVNKFEQSPDEVLPMPSSRSASRSASTHASPVATFSQRTFSARAPSATPSEDRSRAGRRVSNIENPFDGRGLNVRKRVSKRNSGDLNAPLVAANRRISGQSTAYSTASHSMVDLVPQQSAALNDEQPLFGEIVAGQADHGWGIPQPRPRRGSEGSTWRPSSIFKDDPIPTLEAWQSGQNPTLDGIDFSNLHPRSEALQHQRSRSDLSGLAPSFNSTNAAGVPFSQQPTFTIPARHTRQSRLPVRSRASSNASESERSSNVTSGLFTDSKRLRQQQQQQPGFGSYRHAQPLDHAPTDRFAATPHKSPRRIATGGTQTTSPRVGAYINDVGAHEPPTSPPLRSSRTRQSMAGTSSAASRSKPVDRSATVGSGAARPTTQTGKPLPELGGVDFAARRERIQRAFSKSVEAKEAEQRRSLILEAHRRKQQEAEIPPVPTINDQHIQQPESLDRSQEQSEAISTTYTKFQLPSKDLNIDTERASQLPQNQRRESNDDSPTLGAIGLLSSVETGQSSPVDTERRSSYASSGTFMEDEPQESAGLSRQLTGELSAHPTAESVHIVLGGEDRHEQSTMPNDSRWSASSWASSGGSSVRFSTEKPDIRLESINEVSDPHDRRPGYTTQGPPSSGRAGFSETPAWLTDVDMSKNAGASNFTDLGRDSPSLGYSAIPDHNAKFVVESGANDSLSPPATTSRFAQRASLVNPADFAAASPSIGDWMAHQAEDTPIEEKSKDSFSDPSSKPLPPKPTGLRRPGSRPLTPKGSSSPQLPEIKGTSGDWGFVDIRANSPRHDTTRTSAQGFRPPMPSRSAPSGVANLDADHSIPSMKNQRAPPSPRKGLISKYNPKVDTNDVFTENEMLGVQTPNSTLDSAMETQSSKETSVSTAQTPPPGQTKSLTEEEQKQREAEAKRLARRKNIIKELIDTESSFGQDMTVVVDIYKETSHVILQNPEDVRILFGNAPEIVQFSMQFLDSLKLAANSVYKLPRSKRWRSKRDSAATADSSNADESSSISNTDLSEDERDRLTSLGQCFEQQLTQMEKVYTDYLKNHEAASARLVELQKSDKVQIWLSECKSYANDLTTAWSLDSLLVKPVQRILKYPLLLRELVEVTPENHPDFVLLDNASREIVGLSQRINSAKKRADLVGAASSKPDPKDRKKPTEEKTSVFAKKFGRNKDKLRQQVGLTDVPQDKAYNVMADKFGSHFFQVQVVMRDVEVYTMDVQKWVQKFDDFVAGIEDFMDVSQTSYPEVESKWRMFRSSVREIQMTALTDHLAAVKKHVVEPMGTLLKLYDGPQKMMEKRKKRMLDHARWRTSKETGIKIDKKTIEQGEQFVALNDTLKEELPKLFICTKKLVEACLNNFVQLQLQWQIIWRRKLTGAIDMRNPPREIKDIIDSFTGDFKFIDAQMSNLGICNGSFAADDTSGFGSSGATLNDAGSSRQTSLTYDDAREARMLINQTATSRNRAASAHSQGPYASSNVPYYPAAYAQGPTARNRTNSTASGRSREPQTWSASSSHLQVNSPPASAITPSGRPSSQSQRTNSGPYGSGGYDPGSYLRYSEDSSKSSPHWYSNLYSPSRESRSSETQYGIGAALVGASGAASATGNPRGSAIFQSALPPSDSTPPPSASLTAMQYPHNPTTFDPNADHERHANRSPSQYNVLFLAASVYEFNIDRARREAGYPYLTYSAGEIFDVIGEKGELWLAKNQDDSSNTLGWIWNKHFAKLANEA